jgi:hypothetical protein
MRFSALERSLSNHSDLFSLLATLFEKLRRDTAVNKEPLFWLQYSILVSNGGDLRAAESFIETAYARADEIPGFQTFQIDTYALRLFLLVEQAAQGEPAVRRIDKIVDMLDQVRVMISDESRRVHAIEVLAGVEPFVEARLSALGQGERVTLTYHLNLLISSLERLSPDDRAQTASDGIRASLMRARDRLVAARA